jgi:hypothetical protein
MDTQNPTVSQAKSTTSEYQIFNTKFLCFRDLQATQPYNQQVKLCPHIIINKTDESPE